MSITLARPASRPAAEPFSPVRKRDPGRLALAGLIALCCMLAACYSVLVPPFEAPDEPGHYAYVQWIVSGKGIPLQGQEPLPLQPEFSQPPLYYMVEAPLAWLAGQQPANVPAWEGHHNPFQNRTDYGNVNLYLHSPTEAFPWSGQVLGLHLMRLANLLFVALLLLATCGCAIELGLPPAVAWIAAAVLGLVPQVLFLGGALNADNAIGSLSAASLYVLLRWLHRGPSAWTAALLGLAAGAAALSKLSGLVTVGLVLAFMAFRSPRLGRKGFVDLGLAASMVALVAGWWYIRNWLAFGDPLGWSAMLASTGDMLRNPPLSFGAAFATLMQHASSGLAVFGWTNVPVHPAWYWAFAALGFSGLAGLPLAARRQVLKPGRLELWLLILWPLAFVISLARWVEVNSAADQWRLLFPAYPALALLLLTGWRELANVLPYHRPGGPLLSFDLAQGMLAQHDTRAWRPLLAIPAGLLALNAGTLALLIAPAYAAPPAVSGRIEHPANVKFGDSLELVGYSTPQPLASHAGDTVDVDLFWRAAAPLAKDYATDVGIIDAQSTLTWKELSIPDEGRAPMSAWQPGQVVRDRHRIRVRPAMIGAQSLLLSVMDPEPPGNHLPAISGGARLQNDAVTLTRFMVLPPALPPPAVADNVEFQDHLRLAGHSLEQSAGQLRVALVWATSGGAPGKDYTVFVHMLTADGRQVAQHDGQPGGGAFPTSLLPAGASVADSHVLDVAGLAPGEYKLDVGLYELSSGARLSTASGASSVALPVTLR
jgi:4-amino-4-deoxy-L-arabinose transferase-like glycosyltransferase